MAEQKSQGAIGFKIYFNYFAACRNWALVFLMAFLFIVTQMFASLSDYWCSKWQVTFHHVNQFVNQLTIVNSKFFIKFSGLTMRKLTGIKRLRKSSGPDMKIFTYFPVQTYLQS